MNLFEVRVKHYGPKSSHEATEAWLVAETEQQVLEWIDQNRRWGTWSSQQRDLGDWTDFDPAAEDDEDAGHDLNIYGEGYRLIGRDKDYFTRLLRVRGDLNDPTEEDRGDAYYGITLYSWSEPKPVTEEELAVLARLGITTVVTP